MKAAKLLFLLTFVLLRAPTALAEDFFVQGLGLLAPDEFRTHAAAISSNGKVVVGTSHNADGMTAFRWSSGDGYTTLGDLGAYAGWFGNGVPSTFARGVSSDGSVIVGSSTSAGGFQAFKWTSGNGMVSAGELAGQPTFLHSFANGVSGNGNVVVGRDGDYSYGGQTSLAFRKVGNGAPASLGDGDGGDTHSEARAVSPDGVISVGYLSTGFGTTRPTRWHASDPFQQGPLDPTAIGEARALSSDGSVIVGFTGQSDNFADLESFNGWAFRWTEATGLLALGTLPGMNTSAALAISAAGQWTGGYSDLGATLWTSAGDAVLLKTFLQAGGATGVDNWSFNRITGISADGRTLTGWGTFQGIEQPFIATIPEPSSCTLAAVASLALLLKVRRRKSNTLAWSASFPRIK